MQIKTSAFSLVELSIVLVILGLLTGGILAGQSLIRAAELRAVGSEYQRWVTAAQTFRDKYFSIPGDFHDSTRFWGRQLTTGDCPSTVGLSSASAPGACDGNGDGAVNNENSASEVAESFQYWRHLALAGLIEGSYTGIAGSGGDEHSLVGVNVPRSKMSNAGWAIKSFGNYGDSELYTLNYGINLFEFGAPVTNNRVYGRALKPEEAWNIDTKMDDGRPAYGKVIARYWNNQCAAPDSGASLSTNLNASYRLNDTGVQCALYFLQN